MSAASLPHNRTVLMISDEFLSVYAVGVRGVKLLESVPWGADNFVGSVAGIISKDCGKKPVLILNDVVEQHYRKERVIRSGVGFSDKSALLRRKLNVAFPGFPVRAAYPLKEKILKTDKQSAADIYIFAAVASTDQLTKTMAAAKSSLVSISGFCLLPVEASDMVGALAAKLPRKSKLKPRWVVLMGQHRSGGLRQVVTKNGELALTRMSPISDIAENPEGWTQDVYRELKATMSYLSRLGYDENEGLDIVVVADHSAKELLAGFVDEMCDLHVLTVMEAAQTLGLMIGRQDSLHFADPLHVAWIGRKRRLILPMKSSVVDEISKPRRVAAAVMTLLVLGAGVLGYQFVEKMASASSLGDEISTSEQQKNQLDVRYQQEVQRLQELGFDARLVQSAIAVHGQLDAENIKILDLVQGIGRAMGKDLRIDTLDVGRPRAANAVKKIIAVGAPKEAQPLFEARLRMTYPSTANVDEGNKEVSDLRDRLAAALAGHDVKVNKFLKDYEYTEGLVVEAGDLEKENIQQDFVAEILIIGPLPEAKDKAGGR